MAKNTKFQFETIEADWQNVASLLSIRQGSKSEILWINSKFQCYEDFQYVKYKHISWFCNAYAYFLAKLALGHNNLVVSLDFVPTEINCFH